jgi:hypothetical protein
VARYWRAVTPNSIGITWRATMADTPNKNPEKQKIEHKEITKGEIKDTKETKETKEKGEIKETKEKVEYKEATKLEIKDTKEIKETKEKPEKGEIKDTKEKTEYKETAKSEIKDTKELEKQIKEIEKQIKELEKQVKIEAKEVEKPLVEGSPKDIVEGGPVTDPGSIEQRVAFLEQSMAAVRQHFITSGQRPDLSQGALSGEADQKKES